MKPFMLHRQACKKDVTLLLPLSTFSCLGSRSTLFSTEGVSVTNIILMYLNPGEES